MKNKLEIEDFELSKFEIEYIREGLLAQGLWGECEGHLTPKLEDESDEEYDTKIVNALCDMALMTFELEKKVKKMQEALELISQNQFGHQAITEEGLSKYKETKELYKYYSEVCFSMKAQARKALEESKNATKNT